MSKLSYGTPRSESTRGPDGEFAFSSPPVFLLHGDLRQQAIAPFLHVWHLKSSDAEYEYILQALITY